MNDNYDEDYSQTFVFSCTEQDTTNVKQQLFPEGTTWPVVLESFLNFLEASGYVGVLNKVRVEENPFTESDWSLNTYKVDKDAW